MYLHGIVYGTLTPINPISWSLEVEIQFYIAAPLFMQLYRIRGALLRRVLMAILIAGISFAQFPIAGGGRANLSILFYAQFFLVCLLLADIYIVDGDRIRPSFFLDAAGLAGLALTFGMTRTFVNTHIVMPWAMAIFLATALSDLSPLACNFFLISGSPL